MGGGFGVDAKGAIEVGQRFRFEFNEAEGPTVATGEIFSIERVGGDAQGEGEVSHVWIRADEPLQHQDGEFGTEVRISIAKLVRRIA